MKVFWDPDCLLHDPPYEILSGDKLPYFESPARLQLVKKALERNPLLFECEVVSFESSSHGRDITRYIELVHSREYLSYLSNAYDEWVRSGASTVAVLPETFPHPKLLPAPTQTDVGSLSPFAQAGYYCFDLSCPITKTTYSSAIASVGVALSAARELAAASGPHGPQTGVFALCRPPGHHAGTSLCGGYCFFNNVAVAARFLQSLSSARAERHRIAILDIDYHHGNGSKSLPLALRFSLQVKHTDSRIAQEIFYSDPSVLYSSLHAVDDYPYFTGAVTEKGVGEGMNANFNYPLPRGTEDSDYCAALLEATENIRKFDPGYLLVSVGVDTFSNDPQGDFKLSHSCYTAIGEIIADLGKPTLFVMEGGYHMETLGENFRAVLEEFQERSRGKTSD
ncbi:Arginase/deacetylase [Russula earlei]|uniref:Arginase/deacetylase n=1 Tax=Russula earlei TaxID=71964 RepID=A0ACC0UPR3_9AGAM|nr:Arginase/deacetylase [Russula earlei]